MSAFDPNSDMKRSATWGIIRPQSSGTTTAWPV
jgi:hypothetical protein